MFTKEAMAVVKPCYEAIKKIAETQEKTCPKCEGKKLYVGMDRNYRCYVCNGTGKVKGKWEWEPEVGERCIYKNEIQVIELAFISRKQDFLMDLPLGEEVRTNIWLGINQQPINPKDVIPLLHWERIEQILKGLGYKLRISEYRHPKTGKYCCEIRYICDGGFVCYGEAKSRQLAVMQAVIQLGKEE